jgi:hypothetical protein
MRTLLTALSLTLLLLLSLPMVSLLLSPPALGSGSALADDNPDFWLAPSMPPKPLPDGTPAPLMPRVQGDTMADPFIMPAIPFTIAGNTCSFNEDYDYMCPSGSNAPDVVYRYTCDASIMVTVDLCQSTYDSKVHVYEDAAGTPIACNDDFCSWQSYIDAVPLTAGHIYYFVIDGYGNSCGDYVLEVDEYEPCVLRCPPGAMPEGEPDCYEGYDDQYNSGCLGHPYPVFQYLEPSCDPIVICGTTGVFPFDTTLYRDTDWFGLFNYQSGSNICLAGDAEVPIAFMIIDGRMGCDGLNVVAYGIAGPCAPVSDICHCCEMGEWWLWVGPRIWDPSYACGSVYWMELTGYTNGSSPTPASDTTWGRVKELFR